MSPNEENSTPDSKPPRQERRREGDHDAYFNAQFDAKPLSLAPGQTLCGHDDEVMYVARVGSGVLVTMHDTELKIGAMGYVLVPPALLETFPHFEQADEKWRVQGIKPVEQCIAEMKKRGAGKHRIQMRLIGGGVMPGQEKQDVGTKNYIFVREYITRKGLGVLNEDLGGPYVRRVHFFPSTGRAVRIVLRRKPDFDSMCALESKISK
ncbi:MAG: hypothetical protein DYH13_05170 [Alphaproteobacteria bacterium PRO2]|nr:hypothetical protein [Alphaproteobacteria bacterium PRO2]